MRTAQPVIRKTIELPVPLCRAIEKMARERQMSVTALITSALEAAVERERQMAEMDRHMDQDGSK